MPYLMTYTLWATWKFLPRVKSNELQYSDTATCTSYVLAWAVCKMLQIFQPFLTRVLTQVWDVKYLWIVNVCISIACFESKTSVAMETGCSPPGTMVVDRPNLIPGVVLV